MYEQITADAKSFETTENPKRRETHINSRIKELESNYADAKTTHLKIISAREENSLKENYFKEEIFIKLKAIYLEYHGELHEALNEETKINNTSVSPDKGIDIKLRRIEIPPFSGGYDQWRPFYELYVSLVHSNDSISDIQKLHYLKTSVHGEAARLLQHIALEEKNYASAWTILTDRYENKRVLVNTHLRILLSQKTLTTETASGIKSFLDTTTECIHSLRNLEVPVDSWDMILIYSLCAKLPSSTQELWEEQLQGAKNLVEFTSFSNFLETRFRTLESIEHSKVELRKNLKSPPSVMYKPAFKQSKSFHTEISKFHTPNNINTIDNCRLCHQPHNLRTCEQFRKMDASQRLETVKRFTVCINCLSHRHITKNCTSQFRCQKCNQPHHTLLHLSSGAPPRTQIQRSNFSNRHQISAQHLLTNNQPQQTNTQINPSIEINNHPAIQRQISTQNGINQSSTGSHNVQTLFTKQVKPCKALLATALVKCKAFNGELVSLRALIDPGSEATFITESAVQKLRLQKRKTAVNIISLGQLTTGIAHGQTTITIFSNYNNSFALSLEAYVYTNITSILPSETFEVKHWTHLDGLQLADPMYNVPGKIDLLLGTEAYATIILSGLKKGPSGAPIAQNSELGWILSGCVTNPTNKTIHTHHQLINLDAQLRRFWEIEEIREPRKLTEEEKWCENHYAKTHTRRPDGRYQVCLPFKDNKRPNFIDSQQAAKARLFYLEKRFQVNPKLKEMYTECLNDYITSSHMIEIDPKIQGDHYYLPHHAVFKESTTTKLRVVFDASCKTKNNQSLNDCLMVGPTLQNDLSSIINKWRKFKIAYTADITKMYRQIWVDPKDSAYQLIYWRETEESDIKTYALKTVTFDSISEAIESQRQLIAITNSAGFPLRKWASNENAILNQVPIDQREIHIPITFEDEDYVKTLGFQWHPGPDIFKFHFNLPTQTHITKRTILSDISRLFDPHGWISPCIVYAKLIMQELWLQQADWDEPVQGHLQTQWVRYRNELSTLENVRIPRWIHTTSSTKNIQLHGFCDASERAYAAVVYIRVETTDVHVQLVAAKTKIAPLKRISLPRLELCAAVLLSKLLESVKQTMEFQKTETFAWTDSMVTLAWIRSHSSKWKTFVANRVTEIQEHTSPNMWHCIHTKNNPADIASRGLFPSEIHKATMWWQGSPILKHFTISQNKNPINLETDLESRKIKVLVVETSKSSTQGILDKFSKLNKAIRVIAYCNRAIHNFKHPTERITGHLTVIECHTGLQLLINTTQTEHFNEEKTDLLHNRNISKRSKLLMLHPFLDKENLVRMGGRLQNANLPYDRQHPIIIPGNSKLATLLIWDAHDKTHHGGQTITTEYLQNHYWITNQKKAIKQLLKKCMICFRFNAKETQQLMGNLPGARVQIARPFYNTGVDYAGPIEIKAWKGRCNKFYKGYIAIFICLCTKAIHIELVSDLSTAAFIAGYRRFIARRGICKNLYSDNGTNFVGAYNKLQAESKIINQEWETNIVNTLSSLGTQWHFIPPSAPHFGGLWEAGVKSVKFHLRRITGNARLTFEEYSTLLTQIEACLNSRPLCPKSPDSNDLSILTPGHFLINSSLHVLPERDLELKKVNTLDRWNYIQQLHQTFWDKWSTEYLTRLQQRPKWTTPQSNIQIGNLIIIKDKRMPPTHWQLGRITGIHPGEDGLVRVVTIKTATSTLQRPIHKICLLPITDNINIETHEGEKS